jgi:predicted Zn-dependent peptidase
LDIHLPTMVDIMFDIFLNSRFEQSEVDKERPVILQEIGMVEDTPDDYIHVLFGMNFFGDHPLGRSILGTRRNLSQFTAASIKNFFDRLYLPERIILAAAGNLEHHQLEDLAAAAFESIQPGKGFPKRLAPQVNAQVEIRRKNLEQVHICLGGPGLPTGHPKRYEFSLMNIILGGNMSSRLFQEIREKRGLAYSVYSFVSTHVDTGVFGAYAAVEPSRARETTELLIAQLKNLKNQPVSESELLGAKEFIKGNLLLSAEVSENQMVRLAQNEMHFGRDIPLREVVEKIDAATAEDLLDLANVLLTGKKLTLTLLGPIPETDAYADVLTPL